MNRARPVDLRKAMEVAQAYLKAGLWFVPMPVLNDQDFNDLVKQGDSRLTLLEQDTEGTSRDELTVRYFVNARTRMCKVLQGRGPEHEAHIRQAHREEFVEVTGNLMDVFRADTQKAKDAGWKAFGRTPYAKFMEKQGVA
jgi:hypothetical protein